MSKRNMLGVPALEVGGVLADLYEKLGGRNGSQWLARVKEALRVKPSEPLPQIEEPVPDFQVWQKIIVGGRRPWRRGQLWKLRRVGCNVSKDARAMVFSDTFRHYQFGGQSPCEIELVKVTRKDLNLLPSQYGEWVGTPISTVVLKAERMGLYLCPTDIVLPLRRQYMHQPHGETLLVMTEPLPLKDGMYYGLFELHHSGWKGEKHLPSALRAMTECHPFTGRVGGSGANELEFIFWKRRATTPKQESGGGYDA